MQGVFHIKKKHPKDRASKIAIVAIARKLTARIYAVLKELRPYETRPPAPPKADPEKQRKKAEKKRLNEMMRSEQEISASGNR
jgi:hypothetical protein